MKTPITSIKRLALALCFVTPLVSWAVTTTGYEDFGDTAGVILWRGTEANFHASTVIDVAEDGTLGEPYAMTANNSATSWQRFARGQTAYTSPGKVLVYDTAGTGSGYKYNPDCTFTPISFGGMWVKTLAINGQPFSILGNNAGRRYTEFGASDKSTLFKFDASFTINRTSPTTFFGEATVDIAQDATFTAQADSSYHVVVDSAATLKLKGAGTLAVTTMDVNGTLDLSATTRPTISGNVTLVGTIVLPEGTEVSQENPFTVCSGTLSAANAYVKIGDADAALKRLTISGGAITALSDPVYEYTENYPTVVPAGQVFTFIGGDTAESATVASGVTVNGTLNTRGHISLTGLTTAKESMLEVVDGTATVTASAAQSLVGDIKIDAGATMVNAMTADALNYGWGVYVHVYGTLDMGSTRWTVGSNARIYLYEGGLITGAGQGSNGAIDITSANVRVIASGDSTISANMRVRAENIPVEATEGKTLTISGLINDGVSYGQPGSITKQNSGTLVLTTAPTFTKALKLEAGTLELGGTAASSSVTVAASAATVAASSGSTLTGELIFVSHIPSAANKALIASEAFDGAVVLTGTFSSAANITGLGAEVTLRDFTGFLDKSASTSGIKVNVEGTFTQSNGWSYDADRVYLAEIKGNGTMTQSGSQAQLYEVGSIANFTGTFNLTYARIKSNNNAVLDKEQKIATLTVAKTLTVNGGSLTGNLAANDIAVTVDGTPAVGDVLVPVTGTVSVSGTVTVNGDEVEVECVTGEGVKFAGYPTVTVSITVPTVANTTITVTVGGEPVAPATQGESSNTYSVADGATVTVTYTSDGYEVTGGTFEFTASEGYTVDTTEVVTKQYVASITAGETTTKYTTLQAAVDAAVRNSKIIVLANETDGATIPSKDISFYIYTGAFTTGEILDATGDFITTRTTEKISISDDIYADKVTAVKYSVAAAFMAVTIDGMRTLYGQANANDALTAANAGSIGTKVEFLSGDDPASYAEYLPMFDYNSETGVYTKVANPVAAVYSGVLQLSVHRTLADAVGAAEAGLTVKLLADVTLDERVDVNPGENTTLTIDLGGYTLTREGTSGNGSVFRVMSGTVTIKNGTVNCTQDDTAIVANGVYAIDVKNAEGTTGAAVVLETLSISVNSQNGACVYPWAGTTATIKSGTYVNNTQTVYQYGRFHDAELFGMAVNQANVATQLLFIEGGTFSQINPALGDDSWADGEGTFVAAGYESTEDNGVWVVAALPNYTVTFDADGGTPAPAAQTVQKGSTATAPEAPTKADYTFAGWTLGGSAYDFATPVTGNITLVASWTAVSSGIDPTDPTSTQEVTVDTSLTAEEQEAAAIAAATVTVPDGVSGVDAATYKTYFKFSATPTGTAGTYDVAITGFADEVTETADGNALSALEAATAGTALGSITVKPGLYYGTAAGADVTTLKAPAGTLNTTGTLDLSGVTKPSEGTAFFIKIKIGATAFTAEE